MAKERLHNLKQTDNSFQLRGVISRTKSNKFYKSGIKNGSSWNALEFGVNINHGKTIEVVMNGFPRPEVYYYKKGENGEKGTTKRVAWKDRKKSPGNGYRLIGINLSTGKDEDGNNINQTFTEYDAIEWLHEHLTDGESVFINGDLRFSSYTDRNGQTRRKVELVPTQIFYTQKPVDFDADDYVEMCEFKNTFVFSSIEKELDERDKETGRFVLSGYSIGYNSIENVSFIMEEKHSKLANSIRKNMKPGNSIETYGRVAITNNTESTDVMDDWGNTETSPMERVNGRTKTEYIVYRVDVPTLDKETYTEEDINAAIRKIKAAKTAAENFGDKVNENVADSSDEDDWSTDDGFDNESW